MADRSVWIIAPSAPTSQPELTWAWAIDKVAPPLLAGLAIAVVGSLLLPRWNERFKGEREHINQAVTDLRSQLAALQKAASEYWANPSSTAVQEAEIEFLIQDVTSLFTVCAADRDQGDGDAILTALAAEIVTADFGTIGRQAEPDRARLIATIIAEVARMAAEERRRYFHEIWLVRIGRRLKRRVARIAASLPVSLPRWVADVSG